MSTESDYTNSLVVAEWADESEHPDEWPWPTRYVKRSIGGQLAEEIRLRVGAGPQVDVFITEAEISGGWSEWTAETDYAMTVECGGVSKEFSSSYDRNNLVALLEWLAER